jgi:AcrR family transcriptional regulator
MAQHREDGSSQGGRTRQRERAERILDAAAALLLRWGYKRVTIDDIAKEAEVGSGTIYLHWKTRDALFETLMLREAIAVWRELQQKMLADPEEVLLHRMMRSMLLVVMGRPLARALFTGDSELLGKMAQSGTARQAGNIAPSKDFLHMLRELGLLRTDMDLAAQTYALSATVTGFCLADPLLSEEEQIPLEAKGDALARTLRLAFEPETLPSPAFLREKVTPIVMQIFEQVCTYCEQQIQNRMV